MQTEVLDEFLFADDMAKRAPTEEKMQKCVDQVSDSYELMTSQSASKRPRGPAVVQLLVFIYSGMQWSWP